MASNLRVDTILPSSGTTLGIGTASGTINFLGNSNIVTSGTLTAASGTITGNLGVGGVLTYEDVTNIDSVGVITARDGLRVTGIATISGDVSIADKIIHTGDTNTAIRFPAADTITAETAGSERLRVNSSGTLLVGATSYGGGGNDPALYVSTSSLQGVKFHKTGSGQSSLQLTCESGTGTGEGNNAGLQLTQEGTHSYITNHDSGNVYYMMGGTNTIIHRSNGTSRQRQANGGGTNTATYNESASWSSFSANNANSYDYKFINQNSSPAYNYSVEIAAAADVNNTNYRHLNITKNSSSTGIFVVFGNGNVQNANNSYGQTSDVKLKENIVDANSQWDDIKSLRVRNFNFKSDSGFSTHTQIGLIAQETEIVSAGLVENVNDIEEDENGTKTETGSVTKQVKYSVLYMKSVKALQEAQARIETLEAKVAALEGS